MSAKPGNFEPKECRALSCPDMTDDILDEYEEDEEEEEDEERDSDDEN